MNPGEYNNRIEIQKINDGIDEEGYPILGTPSTILKCWSKCGELSTKLQLEAVNVKLENTVLFTVRYCKVLSDLNTIELKDKLQIEWNGRVYKVYLVDYHNFNKELVTFKAILVN
jgi:SPP1 family predicted phage head-tail adaptor